MRWLTGDDHAGHRSRPAPARMYALMSISTLFAESSKSFRVRCAPSGCLATGEGPSRASGQRRCKRRRGWATPQLLPVVTDCDPSRRPRCPWGQRETGSSDMSPHCPALYPTDPRHVQQERSRGRGEAVEANTGRVDSRRLRRVTHWDMNGIGAWGP
ncbi:hypothetical protein BV20DRAFT_747601 [Pilatotrama ljubarskyi]|nr:hypothetical protein BV20DRAFT_747601 [Pilatotrama ljubarskyi]